MMSAAGSVTAPTADAKNVPVKWAESCHEPVAIKYRLGRLLVVQKSIRRMA